MNTSTKFVGKISKIFPYVTPHNYDKNAGHTLNALSEAFALL